jgi:hypothetical protein
MRNISDEIYRGNQTKYFVFNNFFSENRAVYEKMWKNNVQPRRPMATTAHALCMLDS